VHEQQRYGIRPFPAMSRNDEFDTFFDIEFDELWWSPGRAATVWHPALR